MTTAGCPCAFRAPCPWREPPCSRSSRGRTRQALRQPMRPSNRRCVRGMGKTLTAVVRRTRPTFPYPPDGAALRPKRHSAHERRSCYNQRSESPQTRRLPVETAPMRTPSVRALSALCLVPAALAFAPAAPPLDVQPGSRLWMSGSSTVRSFQCAASSFETNIEAVPGAVTALLNGDKAVSAVEVRVPTDRLDCKNDTMNEHMLKALKAKANPTIVFHVASYDLTKEDGTLKVTLNGALTMGGVEKPVTVVANAKEETAGVLRVTGTQEVRMTEWGLKPPSLMLGTMKVDERIKV